MTKNKGYTLVEMMIVIAIMAILSGTSFLTIRIIKQAKRQAATNTFDNQISNCLIKTKATSPGTNGTDNPMRMIIRKRADGAYVIMNGYMKGDDITDASGKVLNPNKNEDCEAVLAKEIVNIVYKPSDTAQQLSGTDMIIQFIKSDGSTLYGGGAYEIYAGKRNPELYATIYLDSVSGNHYVK